MRACPAVARTIKLVSMPQKLSVSEIKAVAEAAITAKYSVDAAKKALEDAGGEDETLKAAVTTAETAYADAKNKADALSQEPVPKLTPEQIAKRKRKIGIIRKELQDAGAADDEDDADDDDDEDNLDKPITRRELAQIKANEAAQTAVQMADTIADPIAKDAVKAALKRLVPSGNPDQDFTEAVAIANREKNNKVLEELSRKPIVVQHRSGAGAPLKQDTTGEFTPTAEEAGFMKPPFNLSKEAIIAARPK